MANDCLAVAHARGILRLRLAAASFAALFAALAAPSSAHAANHALLIGVSNYTYKDITPLKGPANDVTLMWRALGKRGFSDVTVLADGLATGPEFPKSAGDPTRANILTAFEALSQRAKAGDLVLIYYSGHGTQQPARNTEQDSERGNLDQVMLPLDAGGYDRATQTVRNGIVDDDIGAALDKIRARGADVWIIFDACHAGSMTRGIFDGLAVRGIESSRLGIPPAPPSAATRGTSGKSSRFPTRPSAQNEGSLVEFFAVDSSREAIERSFDEFDRPMIGKGSDRRVGVFTYFLHRALTDSSGRVATYRDLAHHMVREMQRSQIAPPAMPTFGGALDRPLLSIGKAPQPAAWQVTLNGNTVEIPAGALHGLTEKSVLKLSASPAPDAPPWAQATVSRADPISAVAEIDGRVPPSPPPALWARVASPGVSFALKVAEPPPHDLDSNTRSLLAETKAHAARSRQGAIDWVGAKDHADVLLRVHDGRLWLLPGDGEWVREDSRRDVPKLKAHPLTPSYPLASSASVGDVADALHKIARARNMVRLAEVADPTRHPTNPWNALQVSAERVIAPGADKHPHRACPTLRGLSEQELKGRAIDLKLPEPVFHCDLVRITVGNNGNRDVDLNLSYIDARAGINKLGQDCTVTVPPGGRLVRQLWVTTWDRQKNAPDSVGREHVVITAVERKGVSQTNLCFIQEAVRGEDVRTRGGNIMPGNAGWLMSALSDAAVASSGTRGVQVPEEDDAPDAPRAGMYLVTLQVTPSPPEP
jgi:hypothetical protein